MTMQEVGVYLFLLCLDWNECGFVLNRRRLSRFCRVSESDFAEAWEIVGECFAEREGRWYNPRLERERVKQSAYSAKQKAASDARWESHRNAAGLPRVSSPFPSPALATTGRSRAKTNGHDPPTRPHLPAVLVAPPWCAGCGDGELIDVEGQKRPVRIHSPTCPDRTP